MRIAIIFVVISFCLIVESSDVKNPNQLEEFIMIMRSEIPERYDCSGNTTEEWYSTGMKNPGLSIYFVISGLIFFIVSLLVLHIMNQPDIIKYPCYKIMYFIGFTDFLQIFGTSFWPGVSSSIGGVYCTHPIVSTLVGKITVLLWLAGTSACVLLGINRLADLVDKDNVLFNKPNKVRLYLMCCLSYGVYGSLYYDTFIYNSVYMAPLVNPMIGDEEFTYSHKLFYLHSVSLYCCLFFLYLAIFCTWLIKKLSSDTQPNNQVIQKHVMAQFVMLSMIYSVPATLSLIIRCTPDPPQWLFVVNSVMHQLTGGVHFIMYIIINDQIRQRIHKLCGKNNYVVNPEQATADSIWKSITNNHQNVSLVE